MTKINLILLSSILLFITACKKSSQEKRTPQTLEGYVTDAVSGDSIEGARVDFYEANYGRGGNLLADYDTKLGTVYTNKKGYFRFIYNASNTLEYGIWAEKDLYSTNADVTHFRSDVCKTGVKLIPKSWFKYHIRNDAPAQASDQFLFQTNFTLGGSNVDTVFYEEVKAEQQYVINYNVTENSQVTQYQRLIQCTRFDTCTIDLFY